MPSRLAELVESGRIGDEASLKRAFRAAAKRIHPDLRPSPAASGAAAPGSAEGADEPANRAFIALRADYEAARALLASQPARPRPASRGGPGEARSGEATIVPYAFSRSQFYESLEDLLGRGFPRRPGESAAREAYDSSRSRLLAFIAGRDEVYPEDRALEAFYAFESGYAALARAGGGRYSPEGEALRSLRFLLSDIVLFHGNGFPHVAAAARGACPAVGERLRSLGQARALAFLAVLVADLDAGPSRLSYS